MITIVGIRGNMGKRYAAICRSQNIDHNGWDIGERKVESSKYIIATPTHTHAFVLLDIATSLTEPASFLVEKPIDLDFEKGLKTVEVVESFGHKVYMVNNYAYYSHGITESEGDTHYDYYNSGKDGLAEDCIQLIHLAKNGIGYLRNENPIWDCMINGMKLNRELIDLCYVKMINDYVSDGKKYGRLWGFKDIKAAHKKVREFKKSFNRCSG